MAGKLRVDDCPGNKDYTNAAVVIVGAGISGTLSAGLPVCDEGWF